MAIIMNMCSYVVEETNNAEKNSEFEVMHASLDLQQMPGLHQAEEHFNIGRRSMPISLVSVDIENFLEKMSATT